MMTNREYLEANRPAFKQFVANNIAESRGDKSHLLNCLEYYAHCFGAGIMKDGTEDDIISSSYSAVLVSGLFGTNVGIPVDAKTWCGWVRERIGAAYERQEVVA